MSKTNSQLITAFVETRQNMELDADKRKYSEFEETIKTRAKKVKAEVAPEETSFNQAIQLAEKFKSMTDHKIPIEEFEAKFGTNVKTGLTNEEAEARLIRNGPNKLSEKAGTHWSILLIRELITPFALLLWAGSALTFVAYGLGGGSSNLYLALIIIAIILITGFISFYQTMKSASIMDSFKDFIPPETIVIRNGIEFKL
jgi:sodium/potassium-transporting ATPase subunit alpha